MNSNCPALELVIFVAMFAILVETKPVSLNKTAEENKTTAHGDLHTKGRNELGIGLLPLEQFADLKSESAEMDQIAAIQAAVMMANILQADFEMFSELRLEPDKSGSGKPTDLDTAFEIEPIFVRLEPDFYDKSSGGSGLKKNTTGFERMSRSNGDGIEGISHFDMAVETEPVFIQFEPNFRQIRTVNNKNRSNRDIHSEKRSKFDNAFNLEQNFFPSRFEKSGFEGNRNQEDRNAKTDYLDRTLLRGHRARDDDNEPQDPDEGYTEPTPSPKPTAQINYESSMLNEFLTITLPTFLGISLLLFVCCFCMRTNGCCCRLFDERHPVVIGADDLGNGKTASYRKLPVV